MSPEDPARPRQGILDTSTVILMTRLEDAAVLPAEPLITRTFDAMIAAIALANDLPVYTCNPDDFEGIDELRVVVVPLPPQRPEMVVGRR